jgi:2-polyprenyl-3-methyl-5-hydroxy-6-metoxy-1,4-benzoquinol methylase
MAPKDPSSRLALAAYRDEALSTRAHTRIRWHSAPFAQVETLLPSEGQILDLGCGHGLFTIFLALRSPQRRIEAVDIDVAKVAAADRASKVAGVADRVEVTAVSREWLPEPARYDAVVINDVLYLMGARRAEVVLAAAAAALRPGGVLVIKEIRENPRWKYRVNAVQERISTSVTRITEGDHLEVLPEAWIEERIAAAGLEFTRHALDARLPHAHVAWTASSRITGISPDEPPSGKLSE